MRNALPASPRKRCVIESLAKDVGIDIPEPVSTSCSYNYNSLSDETKQKVQEFYKGHSMPNQQKKVSTPSDFHEIWHRYVVH